MENDLVYRLQKRAEIRRNIPTRKSVQESKPDRISDLLEEAAAEIIRLREELSPSPISFTKDFLLSLTPMSKNEWIPVDVELWSDIRERCRDLEPIDSGYGTHCSDETFQIENRQYNILYENGYHYPIEITAKDVNE